MISLLEDTMAVRPIGYYLNITHLVLSKIVMYMVFRYFEVDCSLNIVCKALTFFQYQMEDTLNNCFLKTILLYLHRFNLFDIFDLHTIKFPQIVNQISQ